MSDAEGVIVRMLYAGRADRKCAVNLRQVNILRQEVLLLKLRPISNVRLIKHLNLTLFKLQSTIEDGIALAELFMFF
jgi:hypothetical protein